MSDTEMAGYWRALSGFNHCGIKTALKARIAQERVKPAENSRVFE